MQIASIRHQIADRRLQIIARFIRDVIGMNISFFYIQHTSYYSSPNLAHRAFRAYKSLTIDKMPFFFLPYGIDNHVSDFFI